MKRIAFLLIVFLFAACVPVPAPATETPTLTLAPTRTPTLTPTATITPTPAPSLPADFPPEFQAQIGDADFEIRDGRVWVTDASGAQQDWFEQTPEGAWQTSDFKMHADTEMQIGWEPKDQWEDDGEIIGAFGWPVLTGEPPATKQLNLNGQDVFITGLPASIRDLKNPGTFIDVIVPKIFKDKFGKILAEIYFFSKAGEDWLPRTLEEFAASYQRGKQVEVQMNIFYRQGRGVCASAECEMLADLITAQGLDLPNGMIKKGTILPALNVQDTVEVGRYYR